MAKRASAPEALLVHLVVEDYPTLKEEKFAQRCREARDMCRELFEIKEGRPLADAGPIASSDASLLVRGEKDMVAIELWAGQFNGIILRASRVEDVSGPFAQEVKKKEKKYPKPDEVVIPSDLSDDDDVPGVCVSAAIDDESD